MAVRRTVSRGVIRCLPPLVLLLALARPAWAQDERPTGYPRSANERPGRPVTVSAVYTADLRGVLAGGIARGTRYLDNIDLQVAIDTDRLVGWRGARLFVYGIYDNGVSLSRLSGDIQTISNIETKVQAARLFEAWIEQDVGRTGSLKVGLYNLNAEFDTTQSGGVFLLSSHGVGPELSQSGRNGASIFPVTSLAARGEIKLGEHWLGRVAVLDGVPGDPDHPKRTAIKLSARDGALVIGEVDYLRGGTKVAIGVWGYTARFDPLGVTAPEPQRRGDKGTYVFAERRLIGTREDSPRGLAGWLRFGIADARFNAVARYLGGGLVYSGIGARRRDDQVGLSFATAFLSDRFRFVSAQATQPPGRREIVAEAVYSAVVAPWLRVQPDVQYVVRPSGRSDLGNAVVVGLRVKVGR